MILWVVANKEHFVERPKGFFDVSDAKEFLPSSRERNAVMITYGDDREDVKRRAQPELGGNPDRYIVEPLTNEDDRVIIKLHLD